jgi:hypothetical protein
MRRSARECRPALAFRREFDNRFDAIDRRFDAIDTRFGAFQLTLIRIGGGIMVGLIGVIAAVLVRG